MRKKKSKYRSDGIEREVFIVSYGNFRENNRTIFHFKSSHKLTEEDYPAMEKVIKQQTGASWARVEKKYMGEF